MATGDTVTQGVVAPRKILTVIENDWMPPDGTGRHWPPPNPPRDAQLDEWFAVMGRLTDEYGNPVKGRGCALDVIDPDGIKNTYHPDGAHPQMTTDSEGRLRRTVHLNKVGTWSAYWWFGGDSEYEGCPESPQEKELFSIVGKFEWG